MCKDVMLTVGDAETHAHNKAELEAALGGPSIGDWDADMPPNICLCPLNSKATAKKYGYSVTKHEGMWEHWAK